MKYRRSKRTIEEKRYWCEEPVIRIIYLSGLAMKGAQLFLPGKGDALVFGRNDLVKAGACLKDKYLWGKFHVDVVAKYNDIILVGIISTRMYALLNFMDSTDDDRISYTRYVFSEPEEAMESFEHLYKYDYPIKASLTARAYKSVLVTVKRFYRVKMYIEKGYRLAIIAVLPYYTTNIDRVETYNSLKKTKKHLMERHGIEVDYIQVQVFEPNKKYRDIPSGIIFKEILGDTIDSLEEIKYIRPLSTLNVKGCNLCRYKSICSSFITQ